MTTGTQLKYSVIKILYKVFFFGMFENSHRVNKVVQFVEKMMKKWIQKLDGEVAIKTSQIYILFTFRAQTKFERGMDRFLPKNCAPKNVFSMRFEIPATQRTTFQGILMLVGPHTLFVIRRSKKDKDPFMRFRVSTVKTE